jgi:feruloyl esterase
MARSGAFAVAATDTGHGGGPGATAWARDNHALQQDVAQRGAHVVALASKMLVARYYGGAPRYSYFQGCSDGGREGMKAAQMHPGDFDGIVAGAPANYISSGFLRFAWQEARNRDPNGNPVWTATAAATLHAAVMKACDGIDGLVDGQIDAPRACRVDPQVVSCPRGAEQPGTCLSAAQVATARAFYSGPVDATGRHLWLGGIARGSELTWAGSNRQALVEGYLSDMIYGSAQPGGVKLANIDFTARQAHEIMRLGAHYDAYDPDLTAFRRRGGRMIVWEGAADPSAGPNATLNYYQAVRDKLGGLANARKLMRVFVLPGVYHCRGGTMPYEANFLGAIVRWVEAGEAPDKVVAAAVKPDGVVRTRPVYAYPIAAKYVGKGSIDDARNFRGMAPRREPDDRFDWIGTPTI